MRSNDELHRPGSQALSARDRTLHRVVEELSHQGILMMSDGKLPSVVSLVAGGPVKGSWWGHPKGHLIYSISLVLGDHPEVLETKLLSGKVTFVHRRLWPALLSVCQGREWWQLRGLSNEAIRLLEKVEREGQVSLDAFPAIQSKRVRGAARELERRLVVHSMEVHTKTGAHSKILETWDHWTKKVGLTKELQAPELGKRELEALIFDLNNRFSAAVKLPWQ